MEGVKTILQCLTRRISKEDIWKRRTEIAVWDTRSKKFKWPTRSSSLCGSQRKLGIRGGVLGEEATRMCQPPIQLAQFLCLIDGSRIMPDDLVFLAALYRQNAVQMEAEEMYVPLQ
jgi:hypothetical protein